MKVTLNPGKNCTYVSIQRSIRKNGKSTSETVRKLGTLEKIKEEYGCEDPLQWAKDLAAELTRKEKENKKEMLVSFSASKEVEEGERPLRHGGDIFLLGLYRSLGLPAICDSILKQSRAKYDLNEILQTLVTSRILFPCSKSKTMELAKGYVMPPGFKEEEMYRALSLLAGNIDMIQAEIYRNSKKIMTRRDNAIFYDCTNYYFEIEEDDKDVVDEETGEVTPGLRRRGKSKEHRPNPIVQMGMFMDYDGIPLAFTIFPGNQSEQKSLQPLEEVLNNRFGMTDYVVSTDAGLASEENRRYNMMEEREYICVQSIPSLKKKDQDMCVAPEGWRIASRKNADKRYLLPTGDPEGEIYNIDELRRAAADNPGMLKDTTLYKEIIVEKGEGGRPERIIVTYDHDFALYLKRKRADNIARAKKIIKDKNVKSRQSQQDARHFVTTIHKTKKGETAVKIEMALNVEIIEQEERLDGFYAYGTSLDDDAVDVLRIRSFHHEIEHLFRTTKTFLEARPVYLSRNDRIRSHFLICFLAMVMLKMLQRQITEANPEYYANEPLTIDSLIDALRNFRFGYINGYGYLPMYTRTRLTDQLQSLANVNLNTQIIRSRTMKAAYRNVKVTLKNEKANS